MHTGFLAGKQCSAMGVLSLTACCGLPTVFTANLTHARLSAIDFAKTADYTHIHPAHDVTDKVSVALGLQEDRYMDLSNDAE